MRKHLRCCKFFLGLSKKVLIALSVLGVLSSMCFFVLLTLLTDYKQNFVRECERANVQDNVFVFAGEDIGGLKKDISSVLDADPKTTEYEFLDCSYFWGGSKFGDGTILNWILPVDLRQATAAKIGKYQIVMRDESITDGVYLPYLFYASGNYAVGDDFTLTDNSRELTVRVAGFYTSPLTDTGNCYMITLLFDGNAYDAAQETFCDRAVIVSVRLNDHSYSAALESGLPGKIAKMRQDAGVVTQNRYETAKNLKYIMVTVISAIIGIIAISFLIIMFISLNILLNNFIHDHTKIFGILKAMGYKSRTLNSAVTSIFLTMSILSAVCGIGLSYLIFPILNRVLEAQSGVVYHLRFLPEQSLAVLLVIVLDTLLAVSLSLRAVTKVLPMQAIRKIASADKVKKERFTVEKSRLPLNYSISVKNILQSPRQSVIIVLTMAAVSFMLVFSLMISHTVLSVSESTVGTIFGESADASATVAAETEEKLVGLLENDGRVERYLSYDISKANIGDIDEQVFISAVGDPTKLKNTDVFYEGTYPQTDTEAALGGKFAEDHGIGIGDTVTVKINGNEADFTVCGLTQTFVHLGNECMILRGGYEKLTPLPVIQYYISMKDTSEAEPFISELRREEFVGSVSNLNAYRIGVIDPYVEILKTVTVILITFSIAVAFMNLYYLTSYILVTKQKNMAVMKAIGFTTAHCVLQTASEIIVPVIISVLLGMTVSRITINPLLKTFLRGIGLMKTFLDAPLWQIAASGAILVVAVLAFVVILCRRIRDYSFRDLLTKK